MSVLLVSSYVSFEQLKTLNANKNKIGFSGSCNFTGGGLMSNLERVQVFLDWEDEKSKIQIEELQNDFDSFFNKESKLVDYLDANIIKQSILNNFADKDIVDLINQEKDLLTSLEKDDDFKKINKYIINFSQNKLYLKSNLKQILRFLE